MRSGLLLLCLLLGMGLMQLLAAGALPRNRRRPLREVPSGEPKTGCHVVVLKKDTTKERLREIVAKVSKSSDGGKVYSCEENVLKAFTVKLSAYALEMARHLPEVDYIAEEGIARGETMWHLDRIDQRQLPTDQHYRPIGGASGVDVYILDSGIKYSHQEFEFRAKYGGFDPVDAYEEDQPNFAPRFGEDCHGHGTHVSSLCGGKTFGSAKDVNLYSIRVLQCDNAAPWSIVLEGLEYVSKVVPERGRPAIVSMSLGGFMFLPANEAVQSLYDQGITVIVAAGNGGFDACERSPASSEHAITVGGTREGDGLYTLGSGTNYGSCINIFAPGERIVGADHSCPNCSKMLSGTSMSTPLVSGVAAIHLSRQPMLSPEELKKKLIEDSTPGVINFSDVPEEYRDNTVNRLLFLPGSCGGNLYSRGQEVLTSPNYPAPYPPNLNCVWTITASQNQIIQLNFSYLSLEPGYDKLTVYDGSCCDESNVLERLSVFPLEVQFLGRVNLSYQSTSSVLTLVLITDGTVQAQGFNATYSKLYSGTDLVVPDPPTPLPDIRTPDSALPLAQFRVFLKYDSKKVRRLVVDWEAKGYSTRWVSPFQEARSTRVFYDAVFSNSTLQDTRAAVEVSPQKLLDTIALRKEEGYSVWAITDRRRARAPYPIYSAVFGRTSPIYKTEVFVRDDITTYLHRLNDLKRRQFQLVSHSIEQPADMELEATSVWIQDRRIDFNITVDTEPLQWRSYYNLTFLQFTEVSLELGAQDATPRFYPKFVDVYTPLGSSESRFVSLYEEVDESTKDLWFRWGVNTTTLQALISEQSHWEPVITVGYSYQGDLLHFVTFKRKLLH